MDEVGSNKTSLVFLCREQGELTMSEEIFDEYKIF